MSDPSTCLTLQQQFEFLWIAKRYPEALEAARVEQKAVEEVYGKHHPARVRALLDLAMVSEATGQGEQGRAFQAEASQLLRDLERAAEQDPESPDTATLLLYLTDRDWNLVGDQAEIFVQLQRALKIREARLGMGHPETAEALFRLGEAHYLKADWTQAIPFYERALTIYDKQPDTGNLFYQKTLEGLAYSLAALDRHAEAAPFFERALAWAERHGRDPQSLYYVFVGYAQTLTKLDRLDEAAALEQRALSLLPKADPNLFIFRQ